MTTLIRLGTPDDADELCRMIRELADFQGGLAHVKSTPDLLRKQMMQDAKPFECLVAESASGLVGFALFFQTYSTWEARQGIYLEDLYVSPNIRGAGLGRLLLSHLSQLAIERGCARIDWSVLRSNNTAREFYGRIGAQTMPDWLHCRLNTADLPACLQATPEMFVPQLK